MGVQSPLPPFGVGVGYTSVLGLTDSGHRKAKYNEKSVELTKFRKVREGYEVLRMSKEVYFLRTSPSFNLFLDRLSELLPEASLVIVDTQNSIQR